MLRSLGIRLVIYTDDMLLMASSKQKLLDHIQMSLFLLENLGFIINSKKNLSCLQHDSKLSDYGLEITRGEDQKNQAGRSPPAILGTTISSITLPATRLGSNLQWNSDQKFLVSIRKISSQQWPRAASCYISNSNIRQREVRNLNSPANGQLCSSCLYQQKGRGGQHHQSCLS